MSMNAARKTLTTTGLATAAVMLPGAMSKNPKPTFNYKGPISGAPATIVTSKMPTIGMPKKPMVKIGDKLYNPEVAAQITRQKEEDDRWDKDKTMGGRRRRSRSTKRRTTKRRRRATKRRK